MCQVFVKPDFVKNKVRKGVFEETTVVRRGLGKGGDKLLIISGEPCVFPYFFRGELYWGCKEVEDPENRLFSFSPA